MTNKITTTRLDSRRRGVFPPVFQAGDAVMNEVIDEKTVIFRLIERKKVPVARIRKQGLKLFIQQKTDPEDIARAVRQDRDSR
jgi:hypothetical protein